MTYPKSFVRVSSVLLAAVLAWGGLVSTVYADADSISINFGAERNSNTATPTGGNLGVVPVNWQNWNNASNATGTITNLISNTGAATGVSGTWNCANTWDFGGTRPDRDNNAILYYGYLDDTNGAQKFNMTAPYFNYDIYYYAATDSAGFRYATINSSNYYGNSASGTVIGTNSWGTPVKANISTLTEGVNYLRVSSTDPAIAISGVAYASYADGRARGSFGALQIVNTANSQSTTTGATSLTLSSTEISWNNDLTGATNQSFDSSAYGYRIIYTGEAINTFTVDLNGTTTNLPNIKLIGAATNLAFTGTISQMGKTNTVTDLTKMAEAVTIPNIAQVAPQGAVKLGPNVTLTDTPTAEGSIPGAYYVDGTTVSFAKIAKIVNEDDTVNYVLAAVTPTYASSPTNGMDLNVTGANITDNATRTLNSLTSSFDYLNNSALTITSGMMMFNNRNHWVQGGGTITSGYQNADGEYDLYLCAVGTANDMRVDNATIVDNPAGKLNLIKTGNGLASITRAPSANTYSGKTVVLEGKLLIGESIRSTDFYVASGAELYLASIPYNGNNGGWEDLTFTATKLSGNGTVQVGNNDGRITLNVQNVANDGSKFSRVNAYGKAINLNNSTLQATYVDNQSVITLNNSTIVADTFNSSADSTVKFDATSTLDAAIVTSAGSLTMDIPSGREMEIATTITGAGGITKAGAGTMVYPDSKGYTGETLVSEGALRVDVEIGNSKRFQGPVTIAAGATLICNAHDSLGYSDVAENVFNIYGTMDNAVGNESFVKTTFNLYGGTLSSTSGGNLDILTTDNKIISHALDSATAANPTVSTVSSNIKLRTNGTFEIGADENSTLKISGVIFTGSDSCVVTKTGAGTLELTANNTYTNSTQIDGGVLDLTEGKLYHNGYYSDAHVYVNQGGTLKVNNFGYSEAGASSLGGLTYSSNGSTNFHLNGGAVQVAESFGSPIARKIELQANGGTLDLAEGVELKLTNNIHGAGALTKAGAGTLELTYANEYSGGTTISQGEVNLSDSGTLGTGAVAMAENSVLNFNHEDEIQFNNSVSGSGKIYKNGNGVLKIYNPTENAFAAESFVVNAGELDFKGYYEGSLEICEGATFSPGNSVGTLTQNGTFTLDSGALLLIEQDATNGIDTITATTFDVRDGAIIDIAMGAASPGAQYTLFTQTSGPFDDDHGVDFWTSLLTPESAYYWNLSVDGNRVLLSIDGNAVPEPSTWALLALGVCGLLYLRKRK